MSKKSTAAKPDRMAIIFDLRSVIGILFGVYGVVLTIRGLVGASREDLAKAGGIALNLWSGIVMLLVAVVFFAWVRFRPPVAPRPHELDEPGPAHGHGQH